MPSVRQLAAIMFADIAGYTALMQEDEKQALLLRTKLQETLEKHVAVFNGSILEFRGDGALVSFRSTIEAVKAALAIQLQMQEEPKVPLRIGMHTGDVIADGNNIYGDGVNLASRMESFAVPGSIFISAKAYDDIKNQKDIQTVSLGKFSLKNVLEHVEIYAVINEGIIVPDKNGLQGKGKRISDLLSLDRSIFVLPFVNISSDPDQEYFSDGLTEELISKLSGLKDTRVISRTTSMKYKGTAKDIKTIGRENNVSYIMEGSVRKQGNNLRITAQFLDAHRDIHIWSENYRGTIDDIFEIQEKVSEKIADALRIQLSKEEQQLLEKRYTDNTEAYELYLKGRHFWKQRNEEGLKKAINYFEQALAKDSDYALALAGMADTYSLMGEYTNISRRELFPKQMAAVNKALSIDNRLGEAHISLAISLMLNEWDWVNSEKAFKKGLELNPTYATGHHWYAEWFLFRGKAREAFEEISTATELDPMSQGILKDKGIFYYYTGQYHLARDMGMMTLEIERNFAPAYRLLSLAFQGQAKYDEAIEYNHRWGQLTGNTIKTDVALADIYANAGRKKEAESIIEKLTIKDVFTSNDYRGMAQVQTALGNHDAAINWLIKSYEQHEESLCSLLVDPKMDPLREEHRFIKLLKEVRLLS